MEMEIRPEPGPAERQAILAALEELLANDQVPAAYGSAWRAEGVRENVEDLSDVDSS